MRQFVKFSINNPLNIRAFRKSSTVVYMDRHGEDGVATLALGEVDHLKVDHPSNAFGQLKDWITAKNDHLFGHFSYELKSEVEKLVSSGDDKVQMPALFFFQPEYLIFIHTEHVEVGYFIDRASLAKVEELVDQLFGHRPKEKARSRVGLALNKRMSKAEYIVHVEALKEKIAFGDIYEVNLCFEMFKEDLEFDPIESYARLMELTEAPYSCYYKFDGKHVLCASPERFLKYSDGKVWSEPMKGTIRRGIDPKEDEVLKLQLENDSKERSENVMIVDLVRNDLSKHAEKGSVKVEELFGVKTFKTVHQLVSTVSAQVKEGTSPVELIKDAFPMGSMTGAPKIRAMELIDEHENVQRGLYSGSIGYFEPNGDFDLNVVIRTIIYNEQSKYLSLMVGSAITAASDPEKEYEECLLKAEALIQAIS